MNPHEEFHGNINTGIRCVEHPQVVMETSRGKVAHQLRSRLIQGPIALLEGSRPFALPFLEAQRLAHLQLLSV